MVWDFYRCSIAVCARRTLTGWLGALKQWRAARCLLGSSCDLLFAFHLYWAIIIPIEYITLDCLMITQRLLCSFVFSSIRLGVAHGRTYIHPNEMNYACCLPCALKTDIAQNILVRKCICCLKYNMFLPQSSPQHVFCIISAAYNAVYICATNDSMKIVRRWGVLWGLP